MVMECINHPGTAAAGSCQICGKGLCASCVNRFNPPLCEPCLLSHNASVANRLYVDLAVTAVIFIGVATFLAYNVETNKSGGILIGLMLAGAYWGWQFLNRIPMPLIFTSGAGLIICFGIKLTLSVLAGFIVAPWQIFRRVKEIHAINTLKKAVQDGRA
jgi:hypothetical protein